MIYPDFVVEKGKKYTSREVFYAACKHFKFDIFRKEKSEEEKRFINKVDKLIKRHTEEGYELLKLHYRHRKNTTHRIDSRVVDILINGILFKDFLKYSIEANNIYLKKNEYKLTQREKEDINNRIRDLKESLTNSKSYVDEFKESTTPERIEEQHELSDSYYSKLREEESKDRFAAKVDKVLFQADIPFNVVYSDITPEEAERIRKLPQDIKDEYIARYDRIQDEEIDSIIDDIVNKTKYEIVIHYIMNHCIEIDMKKLRKSVETEYFSDENPADFYEYINRVKLNDLSNYYTIKRKR